MNKFLDTFLNLKVSVIIVILISINGILWLSNLFPRLDLAFKIINFSGMAISFLRVIMMSYFLFRGKNE